MSRRWLVAVSIVAHVAVGVGLFASGVWRIERVEAGRHTYNLGPVPSPPEPAPSAVAAELPKVTPKKPTKIATDTTQPETKVEVAAESPRTGGTGEGSGSGSGDPTSTGTCLKDCGDAPSELEVPPPVCGDGARDAGEQCDDGNTLGGDGCSSSCRHEPKIVAPNVMRGLRLSGETQIHPSTATQNLMLHEGTRSLQGTVKVCLTSGGSVASAELIRSTKYDEYDAALLSAVNRWRYQPYTVNGVPVPACGTVTFVYSMQ